MSLLERIIKDRQLEIKFKHMVFHARRPTYEEIGKLFTDKTTNAEICRQFITGWSGVKESDLLKGGSNDDVEFDVATWVIASGDMQAVCEHVCQALTNACMAYHKDLKATAKN